MHKSMTWIWVLLAAITTLVIVLGEHGVLDLSNGRLGWSVAIFAFCGVMAIGYAIHECSYDLESYNQ
jgi:hypothetical protein